MGKIAYIIILVLLVGCTGGTDEPVPGGGVEIRLSLSGFTRTRAVDADNLESEQTIKNISIFLTQPSSGTITHSFVDVGFSTVDDYRLVTLPVEASELATRDIYVIANYSGTDLTAISTVSEMRDLKTPEVDKTNNLDPEDGFCMYGKTLGFDFLSGETAEVYVRRACAKIRVTMTFPDAPGLSSSNEFLIANAASYTFVTYEATGLLLTTDDYFNFAANLPLTDNGDGSYTGIAYIYEASAHPVLYLYTHIGGSAAAQEYSAELPLPERNHLYDCDVRIYSESASLRSAATGRYILETTVTGYDPDGTAVGSTLVRDVIEL
ncbi:MAG: hypothetical protein LIO85_08480 [Rikenellaceae bacterium]|nr:hypothetical protein [Rikenellaceae bacterium]